jgi:cyanophycin synthetase
MSIARLFFSTAPYLLKLQAKLTERRQNHRARFRELKEKFYSKLWTDTATDLGADINHLGHGYYQLNLNEKSTIVNGPDVMLDNHLVLQLAGNKPLVNKILSEQGCPVVRFCEFDLEQLDRAHEFLKTISRPAVIKPADGGSAGKGITTGVRTRGQLRHAALWASCFGERLMIENQVEGDSYRLLFLNGRFLDAIRRYPPEVRGDGKNDVRALIHRENEKRIGNGAIISLHPITVDAELKNHLRATGYDLKKVPAEGETLTVKSVVNQNSCHENESVREIVHPEILKMSERIARALKIELAGIDIICRDITQPLDVDNGVVNEVNTTPALHHHYLINKTSEIMPVALHIQKYILNGKN